MLRPIVRALALVLKELLEVARQPSLVLALILGPFLVLFVFGIGHRAQRPPLQTILVIPQNLALQTEPNFWRDKFGPSTEVRAVTNDAVAARRAVESRQADLAVIVPDDVYTNISQGQHADLRVLHNRIDPIDQAYVGYIAYVLSSELNKQAIAELIRQAQQQASPAQKAAGGAIENIPPDVIAAPFQSRMESTASYVPDFVAFYTPGVLALLLQHMAITFAALSLVRERLLGTMELYQVSPTSTLGVLAGKFISYTLISLGVAAALTGLLTRGLGVPLLGDVRLYWAILALLVFASLGIGLTISLLSGSQEQAVQFSMIVLLASVFFSGFFLALETLRMPATLVSYALPVTHGIIALQDVMLRGGLRDYQPLYALGGTAILFLLVSAFLLRRELGKSGGE